MRVIVAIVGLEAIQSLTASELVAEKPEALPLVIVVAVLCAGFSLAKLRHKADTIFQGEW